MAVTSALVAEADSRSKMSETVGLMELSKGGDVIKGADYQNLID
jgi:hypothetical protein